MSQDKNRRDVPAVYLAGGFRSGWQRLVHDRLTEWRIFDPSEHYLHDPTSYTEWDLGAVRQSDFVLAYMERNNPGGYALALEVGYAKALNKTIVLVEEHPTSERQRYFTMVREVADYLFESLDDALGFMKTQIQICDTRTT